MIYRAVFFHAARVTLVVSFLALISCKENLIDDKPWKKPDSTSLGCTDYLSIPAEFGTLYNNVWNKQAAKDFDWQQCLEKRTIENTVQYGWSWQWPSHKKVIYGYPQIKVGLSPWDPGAVKSKVFPLSVKATKSLTISYDLDIQTNGQLNVATTLWIINTPEIPKNNAESAIIAELMIWTYSTKKHFNPAGKKQGEVQVDGVTWEFWAQKNWADVSGANSNRWTSITFRTKESALQIQYDAKKLINHAIKEKLLSENSYIADVELGNEVMAGSGITWVKQFSVEANSF